MLRPIAQELAETIARTIGYDVVITDLAGIIIGCSDPTRGIGTLNEACAQVAASGQPRWESEEDAKLLKGTKPGVTYPILGVDRKVAGTIALTGAPELVRPFALLVKTQAELYLKERIAAAELQERERNFQALVSDIALFKQGINDPKIYETRAELMGYTPSSSYCVVALNETSQPDEGSSHGADYSAQQRLLSEIRTCFGNPGDLCGSTSPHRFVAFCAVNCDDDTSSRSVLDDVKKRCETLLNRLTTAKLPCKIGIGGIHRDIDGLSASYREALAALQMGGNADSSEPIHCISGYRIEELLLKSEMTLQDALVERELAPLFARNDGDELQDTIAAWCESGFSVVRAAELLHVHRTTVDYRLEKLQRILSVEPRDFREMSRLYWAVVLWRNGRSKNSPRRRSRRR